jgi:hypothetical protein
VLAGWRTYVHATRARRGQGRGWQGVAEAGALGFVVALVVLAGGIATRPAEALPYVVFYGGAALMLGLGAGFVLWITAMIVTKI